MALSSETRSQIETLLRQHTVVLFMKGNKQMPRCGFSAKVVEILDGPGGDFRDVDVLSDPQLREGILETLRTRAGETAEVVTFAEARLTEEVLGVREEYLDAALEVVGAEYGSLPNYLAALGVTEEQVTRLQTVLRG